ncbi:MAG: hypothetical protein PXX73_08180 [Sideroxydans sp.]|nr:hypothetical protein [Sideroxydans sp.]
MSLINQMLSQLERRGADLDATQMVRCVPAESRFANQGWLWLSLLLLIVLLALSALWLLQKTPRTVLASAPVVAVPVAPTQPISSVPAAPVLQLSFALDSVVLPALAAELDVEPEPVPIAKPVKAIAPKKEALKPTVAPAKPLAESALASEALPLKQVSSKQQAEAMFRKAVLLMQQGRINEALAGYRAALNLDAGYDPSRQALVSLLLENKQRDEALQVLQEGLANRPEQTAFAMMAARLQVEHQAVNEALLTLEKSLPFAQQQSDYQAFLAALLQRQNRHQDALQHYQIALQLVPNNGVWLMGSGISLQALLRNDEAKLAYQRALSTQTLQPDLQAFVQQKLKALP